MVQANRNGQLNSCRSSNRYFWDLSLSVICALWLYIWKLIFTEDTRERTWAPTLFTNKISAEITLGLALLYISVSVFSQTINTDLPRFYVADDVWIKEPMCSKRDSFNRVCKRESNVFLVTWYEQRSTWDFSFQSAAWRWAAIEYVQAVYSNRRGTIPCHPPFRHPNLYPFSFCGACVLGDDASACFLFQRERERPRTRLGGLEKNNFFFF